MSNWSDGYFVDFEYIDSYFAQLNPLLINLNLTFAGINIGGENEISVNENIAYLELGFGKGISLCAHALTSEGYFIGTDFNPSHALNATNLIKNRGGNIEIYNDSFEELLERLKKQEIQFDYIVLHGIWSWISYENQRIILQIIEKFLRVGGVVYISYNCFPGWDGKWSSRKLLTIYHDYSAGTREEKIRNSLQFFKDFLGTKPSYLQNNPMASSVMNIIEKEDVSYLAHEFFNDEAICCYFADIVKSLETCKLQFACGANPLWHFEDLELNEESKKILSNINDSILKEQLKDYCFNRQFRSDLFVKGRINLSSQQIFNKFLNTHFVLIDIPETKDLDETRKKIIEFFAKNNYCAKTARDAHHIVKHLNISSLATIFSEMMVKGHLHPARSSISDSIRKRSIKFNHHVFKQQSQRQFCKYALAPLIGGAVFINDITQLFLYGLMENVSENKLVDFVWDILESQNRNIQGKNGEEENKKELSELLLHFVHKIPLYKALGVI